MKLISILIKMIFTYRNIENKKKHVTTAIITAIVDNNTASLTKWSSREESLIAPVN